MLKRFLDTHQTEAGCDEAGRGCLAGPVTAAAVILPPDYHHPLLNDSKQMTQRNRETLRTEIEKEAISFSVAFMDNLQVDELNVLKASLLGMHRALGGLQFRPDRILVDGNRFYPYQNIPHSCMVKGDATYLAIAAASVLAKTYRDEHMLALHREYNGYGWDRNKGYPTRQHRMAIATLGITKYHRRTFNLTNTQLELPFR